MSTDRSWSTLAGTLGLLVAMAGPAVAEDDPLLQAMQQELERSMEQLQLEQLAKPYFISYKVDDLDNLSVSGVYGSLESSDRRRMRLLTVEVRVGDYDLDNSNYLWFPRGRSGMLRGFFGGVTTLALDDDPREIRRTLWLATDGAYKQALEQLSLKRAALQNKKRAEEIPDFTREKPAQLSDLQPVVQIDPDRIETMVRRLSGLFRELATVHDSTVEIAVSTVQTRYVNSEGSRFVRGSPSVQLTIVARSQADDGMPLEDLVVALARRPEELPSMEQLGEAVLAIGRRLTALRTAPVAERYNGPVLFDGSAAAELFAQGFAPHLIAQREPVADDPRFSIRNRQGQVSFQDKIGARVLPRFVRLVDDPTLEAFEDQVLVGSYKIDDEAVAASRTVVIERGILKTLLTGRTPIPGVEHSTGNSRGRGVLPSNLMLETDGGIRPDRLRQELLLEIRDRELDYGILVRRVGNPRVASTTRMGFGMPGGRDQIVPLVEAYRVYPDGREQLIRNAEIADLNPASFKDIIAVSDDPVVLSSMFFSTPTTTRFASGPISVIVPSMLFEDLTLNKPGGEIPNPPVAPHPLFDDDEPGTSGYDGSR